MKLIINTNYIEEFVCEACGYPLYEDFEPVVIHCINEECKEFGIHYILPKEIKVEMEKAR